MILAALAALQAVPVVPSGQTFRCTPIAIHDADGPIWCAEGPRLRLNAVAAREMDGSCLPAHPCPDMPPERARQVVIQILGAVSAGRRRSGHINLRGATPLTCISSGNARGSRTGAACTMGRQQFNCLVIRSGAAAYWLEYDRSFAVARAMTRDCVV